VVTANVVPHVGASRSNRRKAEFGTQLLDLGDLGRAGPFAIVAKVGPAGAAKLTESG
jgi:hypothetical protein